MHLPGAFEDLVRMVVPELQGDGLFCTEAKRLGGVGVNGVLVDAAHITLAEEVLAACRTDQQQRLANQGP